MTPDNALVYSLIAAFIPVLAYVGLIYWVDRYEKEPTWLLSAAFLWGAVPAALLAIVSNTILSAPFYMTLDFGAAEVVSGGFIAPVVEEIAKGLILFAILFFWRHELDSPLDGIIYGAMVGMGFAMVENVLYYMAAFRDDGQAGWSAVVFLRGLVFGLSHALYAATTGLGIALARMSTNPLVKIVAPLLGLALAIFLHALHNLSMFSGTMLGFLAGLSFSWGGVLLTGAIIFLVLNQERRWLKTYLADEVGLGTLSAAEYGFVSSGRQRTRYRLSQLLNGGVSAYRQSGRRLHWCSELAYRKHHYQLFGDAQSKAAITELRDRLGGEHLSII